MAQTLVRAPRGLVGCAALIGTLCSGGGPRSGASAQSAIADELAVIAAACRENSARLESLQLSGTIFVTGHRYERQWDPIAGQVYNSQTRRFSVWMEGRNSRLDVTVDHETDGETHEVQYNLPFGEHMVSYPRLLKEGGLEALRRSSGTPQSTRRTIVTPNECYRYRPESNELDINVDSLEGRILDEQHEIQWASNRPLFGRTVAEYIDQWVEHVERGEAEAEVSPISDGQYHLRSTAATRGRDDRTHTAVLDVIVDLDKGGNVLFYTYQSDGQLVNRGQFEYTNIAGVWVVAHAEVAELIASDGVPAVNSVYDVDPQSLLINQPIEPDVFTFAGLDVKRGARVADVRTGEVYLYDDMPLHLKAALAAEQERQQEVAEAQGEAPPNTPQVPPTERARPGASEPGARSRQAARDVVVLTPTPAPASQPAIPPARVPVHTRVLTPQPASKPAGRQDTPAALPDGRIVPSPTATVLAVSLGCAAVLGVGIWRLTRRGRSHPG